MSLPETTAPLAGSIAAEPFVLPAAITPEAAAEFGFTAITTGFSPKTEKHLLDSLILGLRGKPFRLVSVATGLEVWRLTAETNTILPPSLLSVVKIRGGQE